MSGEPKVTGLSPMFGPPGTKMTIRGENLGLSSNDISTLTINGADCLPYLEWRSSKEIKARCTKATGNGEIIVTTHSGGVGTCSVQFKLEEISIGPIDEAAVWIEEDFRMANQEEVTIPEFNLESEISSSNFDPRLHLVRHYKDVDLYNLEKLEKEFRAELAIKNSPERREKKSDRLVLMKSDLPVYMECVQNLENLSRSISSRDTSVDDITLSIESTRTKIQDLFEPLLAQRDLVQSIENAMQQNETLFRIPSAIDESIRTRNYDYVVKEISTILPRLDTVNEKQILVDEIQKKVLTKVDKLKETIRSQIHNSGNIDETRKLIRLLHKLRDQFDVWEVINEMFRSLMSGLSEREPSNAIILFDNNYYNILAMGQSYFEPESEFACQVSDDTKQSRRSKFDELLSSLIEKLYQILRANLENSNWPQINTLEETLQIVITCYIRLTQSPLPSSTRKPIEDFKQLLIDLRIESMKRLFKNAANINKDKLHRSEDWILEVDDIVGGRTKLPTIFEKNVIETLKFANDVIFKPKLPNEKSILKEISVQGEMKAQTLELINSFADCLDAALTSKSELQLKQSNRILSNYMVRQLITICNFVITKDRIFPRLQDEFEKLDGLKMDIVFKKCKEKYSDKIRRMSESFCLDICTELTKKSARNRYRAQTDRDLQINLLIINSQIFMIAPQIVNSLMTSIVNAVQAELNGVQKL